MPIVRHELHDRSTTAMLATKKTHDGKSTATESNGEPVLLDAE